MNYPHTYVTFNALAIRALTVILESIDTSLVRTNKSITPDSNYVFGII